MRALLLCGNMAVVSITDEHCFLRNTRRAAAVLTFGASAGSSGFSASSWSNSSIMASRHMMSYVLQVSTLHGHGCTAVLFRVSAECRVLKLSCVHAMKVSELTL